MVLTKPSKSQKKIKFEQKTHLHIQNHRKEIETPKLRNVFDPFSLNLWDPFKDFQFLSSSSLFAFPEFSQENSAFVNIRVDWKESPEAHLFKTDVPGLKKEEVKIGERNVEKEDKNKWHIVERSNGKFLRRFQLPKNNGVLSVTIPKAKVKKLDVKAIEISG
ncbi:18.5 kDa class I heat shock protein [Pyrus ussuriensis x Pyrus communis]|uniref:18.5 kDa class I heat shock protein n=1 Tax=Pyrus ussuriensis x Pyrus communis TaxID=2448454 RepID=A0A5N5FZZ7_9ROSA|nr:18.5 kDa class I heat shock protein [Pyrus ussuriensis x Pyrus communis]